MNIKKFLIWTTAIKNEVFEEKSFTKLVDTKFKETIKRRLWLNKITQANSEYTPIKIDFIHDLNIDIHPNTIHDLILDSVTQLLKKYGSYVKFIQSNYRAYHKNIGRDDLNFYIRKKFSWHITVDLNVQREYLKDILAIKSIQEEKQLLLNTVGNKNNKKKQIHNIL